jgi:hypothetical protein
MGYLLRLEFWLCLRSLDWNKLIFGDQLQFGVDGTAPSVTGHQQSGMAHYFDFNAGMLAYNKLGLQPAT